MYESVSHGAGTLHVFTIRKEIVVPFIACVHRCSRSSWKYRSTARSTRQQDDIVECSLCPDCMWDRRPGRRTTRAATASKRWALSRNGPVFVFTEPPPLKRCPSRPSAACTPGPFSLDPTLSAAQAIRLVRDTCAQPDPTSEPYWNKLGAGFVDASRAAAANPNRTDPTAATACRRTGERQGRHQHSRSTRVRAAPDGDGMARGGRRPTAAVQGGPMKRSGISCSQARGTSA